MRRGKTGPMEHLVRIVLHNGASYKIKFPWQRPYPGLELTTKFFPNDYINSDRLHGTASKGPAEGRRAKFENKFKGSTNDPDLM